MQKVQKHAVLTDNNQPLPYSVEQIKLVKQKLTTKQEAEVLYNQTPKSTAPYLPKFILTSINQQYYEIEINPSESYRITCNPWKDENLLNHQKLITVCPTLFISYLANHHPTNECIGALNILATIIDHYNISDLHFIKSTVIFKQNQQERFRLIFAETDMKKLRYYLKLHAHMDPSNTQQPQDGSLSFKFEHIQLDLRVATLPTRNEEMLSIRAFNLKNKIKSLAELGFNSKKAAAITQMIKNKNGLILITGATGAGKSTTLYALLKLLKKRHVITIEDPIEQPLTDIHQTNINNKKGYTLDVGLKAILRHNPDIIAIGEIRDAKTADIVLQAAYSGHLVIASLHTNSIEATLLRLQSLGCSPFLISYCLRGIIAQDLISSANNKGNTGKQYSIMSITVHNN